MKRQDFDFDLPEDLIALRPMRPRGAAKLLVQVGADRHHATVADLADFLEPGDLLVFNDTKVIPARLAGVRIRGDLEAKVELTLVTDLGNGRWQALARPARKLRLGDEVHFSHGFSATVASDPVQGQAVLDFGGRAEDVLAALDQTGVMPLPPYIASKRAADARDHADYQPVFARNAGAIAAPTASLHFDDGMLDDLAKRGVRSTFVTLHVGIGTFLPVKVDDISDHVMHAEWGEISKQTVADIEAARARGGRVIAVGTTALRLLESAADTDGQVKPFRGETDIFISPGYRFKVVDGLMTNFHLPQSTLLMLVSALMGRERMLDIYADAIARSYRFFSYGDASLLLPGHAVEKRRNMSGI